MLSQIVTLVPLVFVLRYVQEFSAGTRILFLFLAMAPQAAANNVTTIYFNSHSQNRLSSNERGRFIANILMLFTLGNSAGTALYGWALARGGSDMQIYISTLILSAALVAKVSLWLMLRGDSAGRETVLLKKEEKNS